MRINVTCFNTEDQAYNLFYHILSNHFIIQIGNTFLYTVTCFDTVNQAYNLFYHILNNHLMIQIGDTFLYTIFIGIHIIHMRGSRKFCQRGSNFDNFF